MFSFKIRDGQSSGTIRPQSADCVGIATDGVLGGAQFVLQTVMSGSGTSV